MAVRWRRIGLSLLTVLAFVVAGLIVQPSVANAAAAKQCRGNTLRFMRGNLNQAARNITITLCVQRKDSDTLVASAEVVTGPMEYLRGTAPGPIFYHFIVNVRLERYDTDLESNSCDFEIWVNDGDIYGQLGSCTTPDKTSTATNGWTADGNVSYDVIGDGKNDLTWSLTGSPMIS